MWLCAVIVVLMGLSILFACPTGTVAFEGVCAAMPQPDYGPSVQPSDDLPPNHGGKREAVVAVDAPRASTATVLDDFKAEERQR